MFLFGLVWFSLCSCIGRIPNITSLTEIHTELSGTNSYSTEQIQGEGGGGIRGGLKGGLFPKCTIGTLLLCIHIFLS